jgi:hypothetical protein
MRLTATGVASAGQTKIASTAVDTLGYDGVMFLPISGTIAATATPAIIVQSDTVNTFDSGTESDLAGATLSLATGDSDSPLMIDVVEMPERYVRLLFDRSIVAADSDFEDTFTVLLYRNRLQPITNADGLVVASPAKADSLTAAT